MIINYTDSSGVKREVCVVDVVSSSSGLRAWDVFNKKYITLDSDCINYTRQEEDMCECDEGECCEICDEQID
jgi:hypothetical protein